MRPRRDRGIIVAKDKYEAALPLLGTMHDTEVAKKVGCCESSVLRWRRMNGIGAFEPIAPSVIRNWLSSQQLTQLLSNWARSDELSEGVRQVGYNRLQQHLYLMERCIGGRI